MPLIGKVFNASLETFSITFVLLFLSQKLASPLTVMHSPLTLGYFFFIVLSTLRLNFGLSAYTGIFAGINYLALGLYLLKSPLNEGISLFYLSPFTYVVKGVILALGGVAAGFVAVQINKSIRGSISNLEKHNRLVAMFGQQISKEIVAEMLEKKGTLESKKMRLCVMFIDIRDFTTYAEKHTPEEVVAYQNSFFRIIIEVVNKNHGIINQFLGDGCMVTFGAPLVLPNPCDNAILAAYQIFDEIEKTVLSGELLETKIGVGIHVGEAVTGNIGSELRQQYSITGNVVIIASRIEQLNKSYNSHFLISKDVKECVTDLPEGIQEIGPVSIKGREEEIQLYKLR